MENKGEIQGIKEFIFDLKQDLKLSKKQWTRINSELLSLELESLQQNKSKNDLINLLVKRKIKLNKKYGGYYSIIYNNIYLDIFDKIKNEKGLEEAQKALMDLNFNNKNFKSPNGAEEFIKEIKLLQEKYPKILNKKIERQRTIVKQKEWDRKSKDSPILVTHELLREFSDIMEPTQKNLSRIRTKIKRAKEKGFL